jgi:hypothetical protein
MSNRNPLVAALVLAVAIPALASAPAQASDEVRRSGSCTGSASVKIKAKHVDSNRVGQRWRWVFRHNGYVSFTGRATTRAPSGSFEVERRAVNARGIDAFKFRAKHRASGQVCVVRVKL